jgi:D-beta-D-heptose 7-phosphate kinase/D-beta-D-heptose 1-phosphate adenosyltransferase
MSDVPTVSGYRPCAPDPLHRRASRVIKGKAEAEEKFIPDHSELIAQIEVFRQMGCIIVFMTGVWDLFHIGHAEYLAKGKRESLKFYPDADQLILVVGVDTDELTRTRKGPKRPIVPENERWKVIAHLGPVDLVTLQSEADQLFRIIEHDVRVISTSTNDIPSALDDEISARCAHLINLPPQAETSTSARIRTLVLDGGTEAMRRVRTGLEGLLRGIEDEMSK